jgi:DNA-binding GntR family transcriptional regulator
MSRHIIEKISVPAPSRLQRLDRARLWDRAYASLKTALLAGRFTPGERIVLRDVADDLGISLTPVRDAVNRLIAERILERGSSGYGGGATVPMLDADQFTQLMTVRAHLESVATRAAADRATGEELDGIERSLAEMKQSVTEHRIDDYLDAHYRFHFGIYQTARQQVILELIENVWLRCGPALTLALPDYIPNLKRYPFHVEALAALRLGDGETAAQAIRADIESACEDLSPLLEARSPASQGSEGEADSRVVRVSGGEIRDA